MSESAGRSASPGLPFLPLVRAHWRFVGGMALAAAVLAAIAVLLIPRTYTSDAAFQAESAQSPALSGALAGLASQLGALQLGQMTNPQFFADLLTSNQVIERIAAARFPWRDGMAPLATIYGYEKKEEAQRNDLTARRLRRSITVNTALRTGVVYYSVDAGSPELARSLAETTFVVLNEANITLRQSRAAAELEFTAKRADDARQELNRAEDQLTGFYARNRVISGSPALQTMESRLRRSVEVAQTVYTQLRLQEEQAAIQALRNTPSITLVDRATTPLRPSAPRRRLSVVAGFVVGLFAAIGWLLLTSNGKQVPRLAALLMVLLAAGCSDAGQGPGDPAPDPCALGRSQEAALVAQCLADNSIIAPAQQVAAAALFDSVESDIDSLIALETVQSRGEAAELLRSLVHITKFYSEGLFADSARFNRMLDHVRVTRDYHAGLVPLVGSRLWPARTPNLSWTYYPNIGVYFQPVNTIQSVSYLRPRANAPTDSLVAMGEAIYQYAIWREHNGVRFPMWEYLFTWNSGGIIQPAPWISAQAQGYALMLFAENLKRTGDPLWRTRGYEVLRSLQVLWDDGGALLPDTTHGYWWEEYHPVARIWNGAAQAVLGVGNFWQATQDTMVQRMFDRGIESMLYYTPEYDTGSWTLYSRVQGYNSVGYHNGHIQILDELFVLSGVQWFQDEANKYRTYTPPPGVF